MQSIQMRKLRALLLVVALAASCFAALVVTRTLTDSAYACSTLDPVSNEHTQNGVFHGWSRDWACDHWIYTGSTNHDHGGKYVEVFNFNTNNTLCDDWESGSTNATCSHSSSSGYIGTYNDTGAAGGCDYFNDGHGICAHDMEPKP